MLKKPYSTGVIIPTYNRWPTVGEAIESVISQGEGVLPVVIDDASTDGTPEKLASAFGDRILLLRQETNQEKSIARNRGIQEVETEFLCCLDSDDLMEPGAIDALRKVYADDPEFDGVAYGGCYMGDRIEIPVDQLPSGDVLHQYVEHPFLHTLSFMIRRQVLIDIGPYRTDLTNLEDVELFVRLMARLEFRNCQAIVARIRKQDDSASINHERIIAQGTKLLESLQGDSMAMDKLGESYAKIEFRVYRELLRAYYKGSRSDEYCELFKRLQTRWPGEMAGRPTRRYWVSRLKGMFG